MKQICLAFTIAIGAAPAFAEPDLCPPLNGMQVGSQVEQYGPPLACTILWTSGPKKDVRTSGDCSQIDYYSLNVNRESVTENVDGVTYRTMIGCRDAEQFEAVFLVWEVTE